MFSLRHRPKTGSGAHLAFYPISARTSFPVGKADYSSSPSAEVKTVQMYTATCHSPLRLHDALLI